MAAGRRAVRVSVASSVLAAIILALTMITVHEPDSHNQNPVSVSAAKALLIEAVRLAQAGDYTGLCQSVALDAGICQFLLTAARDQGLEPGRVMPDVLEVARPMEGRVSLHLRGTYPDGTTYLSQFKVVRFPGGDAGEQVRSVTPVYWSPMSSTDWNGKCTHSQGHVECSSGPEGLSPG